MTMTHAPASVSDEHVLMPADVVNPAVVTFEGQYVWSFAPVRDGVQTREGRQKGCHGPEDYHCRAM